MSYKRGNEALESHFPKLQTFSESVTPLSRNRDPNLTKNEHVDAICCRPEAAGDVISGKNVKLLRAMPYYILNLLALAVSDQIKISQIT